MPETEAKASADLPIVTVTIQTAAELRAKARLAARRERFKVTAYRNASGVLAIESPSTSRLCDTFGTTSTDFANAMMFDIGASLRGKNGELTNQDDLNAVLAVVDGIEPTNEVEALLAVQIAATHSMAIECLARARQSDFVDKSIAFGGMAAKLLRTFTMQAETLAKLRRGGGQTVRVEHVHVHAGGQAIVGNVAPGGGSPIENEDQPHAKPLAALVHADAPFDPLRRAHSQRERVPVARNA